MSRKKKPEPLTFQEIDMHIEYNPTLQWVGEMSVWTGDHLDYVISAVAWTAIEMVQTFNRAAWLAETGLREGNLILPDMGDFKIRYPER